MYNLIKFWKYSTNIIQQGKYTPVIQKHWNQLYKLKPLFGYVLLLKAKQEIKFI